MITRRNFIVATAATASSPLAEGAKAEQWDSLPLRALPKVRTIYAKRTHDGRLLLVSDGRETPQKLIKPEPLERAFGRGITRLLPQPDHWRMIEEGWFSGEDLYQPVDSSDPALWIWKANYRPATEAHDLIYDLLGDQMVDPISGRIRELGLELGEHPCTPRYATAELVGESFLPRLADAVAVRTTWMVIDGGIVSGEFER